MTLKYKKRKGKERRCQVFKIGNILEDINCANYRELNSLQHELELIKLDNIRVTG